MLNYPPPSPAVLWAVLDPPKSLSLELRDGNTARGGKKIDRGGKNHQGGGILLAEARAATGTTSE